MKLIWLFLFFYLLYKALTRGKTLPPWENRGGRLPEPVAEGRPDGYVAGPWSRPVPVELSAERKTGEDSSQLEQTPGEIDPVTNPPLSTSHELAEPQPSPRMECNRLDQRQCRDSCAPARGFFTAQALKYAIVWSVVLQGRGGRWAGSNLLNRK
ncbi:hypothetical protein [Desulfurispora thermophila]|uniref:hypothetical protein n=1 Tax=Desulfurispora thermophila TaxID=265470 RepID=UPI00038139D0|nr:hypothetical protein [Desulfurispora thermophila]